MKKVVLFFAVVSAFAFASCDTKPAEKVEDAAATVDSLAAEVVDSAVAVVDSAAAVAAVVE